MNGNNTDESTKKQGKMNKGLKIALWILASLVVIIIVAFIGTYIYLESLIETGEAGVLVPEVVISTVTEFEKDHVNVLVCGIDADADDDGRDYADGKGMTDVILMVSFNVKENKMDVIQIPRDTYIGEDYSTNGTGKINAVYANGPDQKNLITNLATVINEQYNLPIDYYVTVDTDAFQELYRRMYISLGGIEMYVPFNVEDDEGNKIKEGLQDVSPASAQWLLQQRDYPTADIGRLSVHDYFYAAMFQSFLKLTIADIIYFIEPFSYFVNTDLDVATITGLGSSMLKLTPADIIMHTAPGGAVDIDGHSCFGVNAENMAEMLNDSFRPYGEKVPTLDAMPTGFTYPYGESYDAPEPLSDKLAPPNED